MATSVREAARVAARERLLLRSPACQRRVKQRERQRLKMKGTRDNTDTQATMLNSASLSPVRATATTLEEVVSPVLYPPTNRRRLELFQSLDGEPTPTTQLRTVTPMLVTSPPAAPNNDNGRSGAENFVESNQKTPFVEEETLTRVTSETRRHVLVGRLQGRGVPPPNYERKGIRKEGRRRQHGKGRDNIAGVEGGGSATSPKAAAARRGERRQRQKKIMDSTEEESNDEVLPILGTPPGWVQPEPQPTRQRSPRRARTGICQNLLFRLQESRQALQRIVAGEPIEDQPHFTQTGDSEQFIHMDNTPDSKETPGSGCDSADKLRLIREEKRPITEDSGFHHHSAYSDGGDSFHLEGDDDFLASEAAAAAAGVVTHVWVPRPVLGLSPAAGSDNMLFGEVEREFVQLITGAKMYKVHFGGVIGTRAVETKNCYPALDGEEVPAVAELGVGQSYQCEESTFTLNLPYYLEDRGDDTDDEAGDPDWEANFSDWQGNSDSVIVDFTTQHGT